MNPPQNHSNLPPDHRRIIFVSLPIDAAFKALKKNVDWCKQPVIVSLMSNQPDPNNRVLSLRISRELYRKLQKEAKVTKQKFNEFIRSVLLVKTDHVVLEKADYDQILKERAAYVGREKSKKEKK